MDIKRQIILERISRLSQLDGAMRDAVQANPELASLISETNALANAASPIPPAPDWEGIRHQVLTRAAYYDSAGLKGWVQNYSVRPWYAKAAAIVILVAIVCIIAMILPHERPFSVQQASAPTKHAQIYYSDTRAVYGNNINP
ncbi:hypothetical protein JW859_09350 [bacterium]|nr:hypothetical protein [bacterium]